MTATFDRLNSVAAGWTDLAWAVIWQWTALALVVVAISAVVLRRASPAIRFWVGQVLLLKLLLMPFWTYSVPLPEWVPEMATTVRAPVAPTDSSGKSPVEQSAPPAEIQFAESPQPTTSPPATSPPRALPKVTWQSWLLAVWGAVVILQIARLVKQRFRLGRLIRQAKSATDETIAFVRECAGQLCLPVPPRTLLTVENCSPFVCGIVRPILVLPERLATELERKQLRHVILHELAHIRRRDLAWGWLPELARIIWWFHPGVHWLCRRVRLERELACDQRAMSLTGQDPVAYAETLVRVVSRTSEPAGLRDVVVMRTASGESSAAAATADPRVV